MTPSDRPSGLNIAAIRPSVCPYFAPSSKTVHLGYWLLGYRTLIGSDNQ